MSRKQEKKFVAYSVVEQSGVERGTAPNTVWKSQGN